MFFQLGFAEQKQAAVCVETSVAVVGRFGLNRLCTEWCLYSCNGLRLGENPMHQRLSFGAER